MIADSTTVSNTQGIRYGTKAFAFSIANILGEKEEKREIIGDILGAYPVPVDHSTPKPDNLRMTKTDYDQFRDNERTDILKQSLEIAFQDDNFQDYDHFDHDNGPCRSDDASPNSSFHSDVQNRMSSPCDFEPRRKKARTSFTAQQLRELEARYVGQRYIAANERSHLARSLKLSDQQVKTWFQNRRMKEKRNIQDGDVRPQMGAIPHPVAHPAMMGYPAPHAPHTPRVLPTLPMHSMPTEAMFSRPQGIPIPPTSSAVPIPIQPTIVRAPIHHAAVPQFVPTTTASSGLSNHLLSIAGDVPTSSAFAKVIPGAQLPMGGPPAAGFAQLRYSPQMAVQQRPAIPAITTPLAPLTVATSVYM